MIDKELKHLSRSELLEILIKLSEENEKLKSQLEEVQTKADKREITIDRAGSIAEASIQLNGVFDAAQDAAAQYLENIKRLSSEYDIVREQSAIIRAEADEYNERMRSESYAYSERVKADADAYSERVRAEADEYSRKVRADAMNAVKVILKKVQSSLVGNGDSE